MKVLVCGGRDFYDWPLVLRTLSRLSITRIIEGGASGADFLAKRYAKERGIECDEYRAMWSIYGRSAGAIRNQLMLDAGRPALVVAFPGGNGTADMVRRARVAGIEVNIINKGE